MSFCARVFDVKSHINRSTLQVEVARNRKPFMFFIRSWRILQYYRLASSSNTHLLRATLALQLEITCKRWCVVFPNTIFRIYTSCKTCHVGLDPPSHKSADPIEISTVFLLSLVSIVIFTANVCCVFVAGFFKLPFSSYQATKEPS